MSRFFRRIFVSVWIILIATMTLTVFLASLLPASNDESLRYDSQLVRVVADDLRTALAQSPATAARRIADRHVLDFGRLMQIYVLDEQGRDVLERRLPFAVSRLYRRTSVISDQPLEIRDPRIALHSDGLRGHLVVGFQAGYPLGRVLVRPGARALLLLVAILVSAAVSLILARFIVLPVRRLQQAGHRVAEGDLSVRVAHTVGGRQDDIAQLARDFDAMTERIERLLTAQRRLMRDVSHELRSPLARLQALLSLARQRLSGEDDSSILDRMEAESERLNRLIEEILSFARIDAQEDIDRRHTDIADLVRAITDDAAIEIGDAAKDVSYRGPERLTMDVDSALLHSAIENVVRNAVRFTEAGTTVGVSVSESDDTITVTVDDHGSGVPDNVLNTLFEPFYQVDESRSPQSGGSGVGLAIAKRAIELHGGQIHAENRTPGGLRVVMRLPKGE